MKSETGMYPTPTSVAESFCTTEPATKRTKLEEIQAHANSVHSCAALIINRLAQLQEKIDGPSSIPSSTVPAGIKESPVSSLAVLDDTINNTMGLLVMADTVVSRLEELL